jgi:hypothetical protein
MNWLKFLMGLSALLVAGCAAYFSVTGLGVLFAGASVSVMVMAGSLEFAKLVAATYLKQKWDYMVLPLKEILMVCPGLLMKLILIPDLILGIGIKVRKNLFLTLKVINILLIFM